MKKILSILLLSSVCIINAQTTLQSVKPFKSGEKLSYIASYNMKGLMTDLAGIDMEVSEVTGKKRPIYKLKFTANTLTSWDGYVKVRHAYQSYIDVATLKPLIMNQDSDIKGHVSKGKYKFSPKTNSVNVEVTKTDAPTVNKNLPLLSNSYDIVTLLYLARTLNYDNYKIGKRIPYHAIVLERSLPVSIKYMGKETINVKGMGPKECFKIGLVLKEKFVVAPNVTFMWITTDKNRVPVLISTVFKEGKALVKLNSYEGLSFK